MYHMYFDTSERKKKEKNPFENALVLCSLLIQANILQHHDQCFIALIFDPSHKNNKQTDQL